MVVCVVTAIIGGIMMICSYVTSDENNYVQVCMKCYGDGIYEGRYCPRCDGIGGFLSSSTDIKNDLWFGLLIVVTSIVSYLVAMDFSKKE